jgi:hypothetical protein
MKAHDMAPVACDAMVASALERVERKVLAGGLVTMGDAGRKRNIKSICVDDRLARYTIGKPDRVLCYKRQAASAAQSRIVPQRAILQIHDPPTE